MIQSTIGHLELNVYPQNLGFYRDLFAFTGWRIIEDNPPTLGVLSTTGASVWVNAAANDAKNERDGVGLNHLALAVPHQKDVDQMVAYLQEHGIQALFGTPRHRPEFSEKPGHTYYQVSFESPEHILFEVVYTGPKDTE